MIVVDQAPKHLPAKLHSSKVFSKYTDSADPDFGDRMAILALRDLSQYRLLHYPDMDG